MCILSKSGRGFNIGFVMTCHHDPNVKTYDPIRKNYWSGKTRGNKKWRLLQKRQQKKRCYKNY